MRTLLLVFFSFSVISGAQTNAKFITPFEKGNGNQSTTYEDCIAFYQKLDAGFGTIRLIEKGLTDSGRPLHIVVFSANKNFSFAQQKAIILINNGIHPGEPDGIDASMQLLRDLATEAVKVPRNVMVVVIPVYNVDGMLNRNSTSRANQNGPEAYGFRGNGRNYDLNRDFIKSDTKNARSFQQLFGEIKPDIFIDNHVSNGADYQYTFTCIATQHERLGKTLGDYFTGEYYPAIVADMAKKKIDVAPYVNVHSTTPDKGYEQFTDTPRYATGYSTLFNALGFVPETHMLKPFADRVKATYAFLLSNIDYADSNWQKIKQKRNEANAAYKAGEPYPIAWSVDSTQVSMIGFRGYEGGYKPSGVSGKDRLFYDRTKPFTKQIPFYANHKATKWVTIPKYYAIAQSQWQVIDLLKLNNIIYRQMQKDTLIEAETYRIAGYETYKSPYEGHYAHYDTKVEKTNQKITLSKGDYLFTTDQPGVKYLLETLEPEAVDSFFNWNFFDTVLQQKEYFSAYVFEDMAAEILEKDKVLKAEFEARKTTDKTFAENAPAQLDWIYKRSAYYEKEHLRYPVYRIVD